MILLKKIFSLFKLIFNFVAWLLSLLYSEIFKIREYRLWLREDSWHPGPVTISIGNLEMGGGGKTPFSIFLLKQFKKNKQNFAHSSRAYKSSAENNGTVINAAVTDLTKISSSQVGDEPLMLMRSLEHGTFILGKKRKLLMSNLAQQLAMKTSFDVILLEDAFQHWNIERDVDVVLVDASSSMDSYQLAPLGRLREEKKYLWRADIVVFSKWNLISDQTRKAWVSLLSPHIRLDAPLLKMLQTSS